VCTFFIVTKERAAKESVANLELFHKRSQIQVMSSLPLPIEYTPQFTKDYIYRKAQITGTFLPNHTIYLENRHSEASPEPNSKKINGFHIMAPFLLDTGQIIWVNMGWTPRDPSDRLNIPDISPPREKTTISGYISNTKNDMFEMSHDRAHVIKGHVIASSFHLHDDIQDLPNRNVYPFILVQTDASDGIIVRPTKDYFFVPDYSFDISSWVITLIVSIFFWLISSLVTIRRNK
jgi:hypothetical protein